MNPSRTVNSLLGKSLRNRAMIANALCVVAEEEVQAGHVVRAAANIRSARGVLGEISLILEGDTDELPISAVQDAADVLSGLNGRIHAVETALGVHTIR